MVKFRDPTPTHHYVAAAILAYVRRDEDPTRARSIRSLSRDLGLSKPVIMRAVGYCLAQRWMEKAGSDRVRLTEEGIKVVDDNKPPEEERSGIIRASDVSPAELAKIRREAAKIRREAGLM